jgi:hypothetical protein
MARTMCKMMGVAFLLAGLLGFPMPHLLGFHLTTVHNLIHLATAAVALYLGFAGTPSAARTFCIAFGAVYLALGLLGFVAPGLVATVLGHPPITSGELLPDNLFHIVAGGAFLVVGLTSPRDVAMRRAA